VWLHQETRAYRLATYQTTDNIQLSDANQNKNYNNDSNIKLTTQSDGRLQSSYIILSTQYTGLTDNQKNIENLSRPGSTLPPTYFIFKYKVPLRQNYVTSFGF
jgi:hypothetical protein